MVFRVSAMPWAISTRKIVLSSLFILLIVLYS
jgi:hypothetical protein